MTRDELVAYCKLALNVNSSQLSDDITDAQWIQFVQMAYKNVYTRMRNQVSRDQLLQAYDATWTAGSATYTLPIALQSALIYDIVYTDSSNNPLSRINGSFETRNVFRLQSFGAVSPGPMTFRIYYIANTETLAAGSQSPSLFPEPHHEVIAWEALITIKMLMDKEVPGAWMQKRDDMEYFLVKELSVRPLAFRANVASLDSPMLRPAM